MSLPDPAAEVLRRLGEMDEICHSEPPRVLYDQSGELWGQPGDCWCTKAVDHDGLCVCEICEARVGMPGWNAS